jgi:hypothetical protein
MPWINRRRRAQRRALFEVVGFLLIVALVLLVVLRANA